MPIYEYQCQGCGTRSEVMQRVGDPPPGACSECGAELRKLVSAPAFQFKGSGWYVTDYARKSDGGKGEKSSATAKSDSGSKSESSASNADTSADTSAGTSAGTSAKSSSSPSSSS